MSARRQDFLARFDWIRTGLCFEPRGHDMMSGGFLYPPTRDDTDVGILFIETSGCLPMCGHGTIGIITRSEEHTSELQSLMRNSYAVFCLKKKKKLQQSVQNT